ncbi:MAG TPA: zinc-dependent alcohol dehydrogenase family protein [Nocardioides sp.]|uniref:zinc-dependent alcohol dehydrogenase family protein n=1 Tax=Nocardioides sp. TaxID=35761 RepID=UPI002CBB90F4|nr:zinc-dependent alcohol dehydrogenase family protein [Nocardioides sp.]HTW13888.1 zinc-dependent alcohol dehydrogenase family protein [Nocardioides sp.]
MTTMRAWAVERPGPAAGRPLRLVERDVPAVLVDGLLVQVEACGVCRTDLHLVEGDLPPRGSGVVPGHQVVGTVVEHGSATTRFAVGDRVGIAWLRSTCGECRWCRSGAENLCTRASFTGWDADGGFAQYAAVPAAYAYPLPAALSAEQAAPLLCAGIIGYRALRRANLPPGGRLGIYGFGSSAHLTGQLALAEGAELHVMTRDENDRALARTLGATWVGTGDAVAPVPLDAAIVFAPAGELVPVALSAVDRGGTVVLAGIHMSDVPPLTYRDHLFMERDLRSVAANTRRDGEELLVLAARLGLRAHVTSYPFDHADEALRDLAGGRISGSAVLTVG